jgi:phosphatidylinositol glycan class O
MSGTILSYAFIANHWAAESTLLSHPKANRDIGIRLAPRFVYAIGAFSLAISVLCRLFGPVDCLKLNKRITSLSAAMLCSWSPTILILLGRQGSLVALICIIGGTLLLTLFFNRRLILRIWHTILGLLESFFLPLSYPTLGSIVSENFN